MKKVLLYGTFDIVHKGHLDFMRQAKENGDFLIIIVARDKNVKKIKGRMSMHDENKRLNDVKKAGIADKVMLGSLNNPYDAIMEIKPDIICLGYDQIAYTESLSEELEKRNLYPKIIRLNAYKPHKYKSSIIKKNLINTKNPTNTNNLTNTKNIIKKNIIKQSNKKQ